MIEIFREIIKGKSLSRTLVNISLRGFRTSGKVVDAGGQGPASHYRFLDVEKAEIKTINIEKKFNPDYLIDVEKDKFPLDDESCDAVLCFNLLEHVFDEKNLLSESCRILKKDGFLLGSVPFLVNVHPDPHDYKRYTKESLYRILNDGGFGEISIKTIGKGPYTAAYSHIEFTIPVIFRPFLAPCALFLDALLSLIKPKLELDKKFVLGYVFYARK